MKSKICKILKKILITVGVLIVIIAILNIPIPSSPKEERAPIIKPIYSKEEMVRIKKVQERHTVWLLMLPGVNGTGISSCDGRLCISVFLRRETIATKFLIPDSLEGFLVKTKLIGEIIAL